MPDCQCGCGCGGLAPIAAKTNSKKGYLKGKPMRFIKGHQSRGRSTWNTGLTKDTDSRVAQLAITLSAVRKGQPKSTVHKTAIGIAVSKSYENNPAQRDQASAAQKQSWDGITPVLGSVNSGNRITEVQFWDMVTAQDSCCWICSVALCEGGILAVDHDHQTGKIRGIAHSVCNWHLDCPRHQTKFKDVVK